MAGKTQHLARSTCPIACALDLIGDHWTLVIVRDMLLFNRHEYREFLAGDEAISTNILSDRLAKLEAHGLVDFLPHPESKKRKLYYLTSKGKDLIHVLMAIGQWSARHFSDRVILPPEVRKLAKNNAKALDNAEQPTTVLLRRLEQWERETRDKLQVKTGKSLIANPQAKP